MGKIGERNWLHKCPRADLKMTGRLSYLAGRAGVPRDLDLEEIATKLLSRVHHSFLYSVKWERDKGNKMLNEKSPKSHPECSTLEMCFGPHLSWG